MISSSHIWGAILSAHIICITPYSMASSFKQRDEAALADFLGVPVGDIFVECNQGTFGLTGDKGGRELSMCLSPWDKENRCEISVTSIPKAPEKSRISFEVKLSAATPSDRWHTIMQIQSFPDKGEEWRCPPFALEAFLGKYRAFSRWDTSPVTISHGYNCTEAGGSIRARQVTSGISVNYDQWQSIVLDIIPSPYRDGRLNLKIGQKAVQMTSGGNIYNDAKTPYLKLGVYKPSGWDDIEKKVGHPICVSYRHVKIAPFGVQ